MLFACKKESTTPDCINLKITEFSTYCGKSSKVELYMYRHKEVYLFDNYVPDAGSSVYDCNCNDICSLGGIGGKSTCSDGKDFYKNATYVKTIWTK